MLEQDSSTLEITPIFDTTKQARLIMSAAKMGIILSLLYLPFALFDCGRILAYSCGTLHEYDIFYQTIYYLTTAITFLVAGILLKNKNRSGIIIFLIGWFLIVLSTILPSQIFFYSDVVSMYVKFDFFVLNNLFTHVIAKAIKSTILILPVVGVIYYFGILFKTFFNLDKWRKTLNLKPFILKSWLLGVCLISGIIIILLFGLINSSITDEDLGHYGSFNINYIVDAILK